MRSFFHSVKSRSSEESYQSRFFAALRMTNSRVGRAHLFNFMGIRIYLYLYRLSVHRPVRYVAVFFRQQF